ncbi:stalk domain-containing protein [Paenibacillus sp. HW567]|uniref:stalk domain-containing protein n=1 Tax=Paenibacillus sp. HW567 TaxID=1034769 RepID=UPI000365D93C|nr:stalk domain-containing protein [Paenibacillus sp. HW567]
MGKRNAMKGFVAGVAVTASVAMSVSAYADSIQKQIAVTYDNIIVKLNGQEAALKDATGATVKPFIYNGTVYLPARAISEAVGLTANYDKTTKTVSLTSTDSTSGAAGTAGTASAGDGKTGTPPEGTPPTGTPPEGTGGGTGSTVDASTLGSATYSLSGGTASKTLETFTATAADASAVKVTNGGVLTLTGVTLGKTGATSSEDNSNFYGLNAALAATAGSTVTLKDSTVTTDADGANAVFATGAGSTINVSGVTINTTANSSRGLDATYTGTVNATNVNITTAGTHSASIATDRGNGTVNVSGGTMNTSGTDSPGIYSTGSINVIGATLTASGSEAAVIEGKNSITLNNTYLSGAAKSGVMLYQSFSGDAEVGTSTFTMNGGALTAYAGPLFYSTNTNAVINLKEAGLTSSSGILLKAAADKWGTSGANGASVTLNADSQTLRGEVTADAISSVALVLSNGSSLSGAIDNANTAKTASLSLDASSSWNVTGDSYLSTFTDSNTTFSNITDNGHTIYYDATASANNWLNGKTIYLSGGGMLTPAS